MTAAGTAIAATAGATMAVMGHGGRIASAERIGSIAIRTAARAATATGTASALAGSTGKDRTDSAGAARIGRAALSAEAAGGASGSHRWVRAGSRVGERSS